MIPERIGPFHILEKLGSGGMGNVYLARHEERGETVALKVLTAALAREPGFVERFDREIDALRKLDNPHIVRFFECGIDGESYYYAMEHVAGDTLMALIRREKRIPWRNAVEITLQICQALKAAHDMGIVHRDLKPSNLMIAPDGQIKLADFGVAQVFDSHRLTSTGGIIGTAEYMSPEQAEGKRATRRSDLYSLGAILYVMITGRTPFAGSTAVEVMQKHKFGLFDRPRLFVDDLPARIEETICKLLEKDPEKRFPDALVLSRHLEQQIRQEDYSRQGATFADNSLVEASGPTVAVGGGADSRAAGHPGPATLMKHLVREELSPKDQGSLVSGLFNNTYVLLLLLALVIAGGAWWLRPRSLTPQQLFDAGAQIMQEEPSARWLEARRDYFEPLLAADAAAWESQVTPHLRQIELYELTRRASSRRGAANLRAATEHERLLQLAMQHLRTGDTSRARQILEALRTILAGDETQAATLEIIEKLLADIGRDTAQASSRAEMLESALQRAAQYAAAGKNAEARDIWQAILALYAGDSTAADFVARATQALSDDASAR
jgi:serine/threonine protein kinase